MIAETLEALNEAREKSGASENEVLFGGIEGELEKRQQWMQHHLKTARVKVDLLKRHLKNSKTPHELQMS